MDVELYEVMNAQLSTVGGLAKLDTSCDQYGRPNGRRKPQEIEESCDMRKTFLQMINAIDGRWEAAAELLGMTRSSLENRVYERKGQQVSTDDAMQLQVASKTAHFAEAIAARSGGVFVPVIPVDAETDYEEILAKYFKLTQQFGLLAKRHQEATADGEVDQQERADLTQIAQTIHQAVEEVLQATFAVYCKPDAAHKPAAAPLSPVRQVTQ